MKSQEVTRGTKTWTPGKVNEVQFGPTIISGSYCDYLGGQSHAIMCGTWKDR